LRKQIYGHFKKFRIVGDCINILTKSLEIKEDVFLFKVFIDFSTETKVAIIALKEKIDFLKN
jgi:hypothetical protein